MYIFSIILTKTIYKLIRVLGIGSGYTWPGHIALGIFPGILKTIKNKLPEKVVFISGTNGKTTTSKLIRHIMEKQGLKVLHNDTGANLLNGVVSSVLLNSDFKGNLAFDIAVFELDEFTIPKLMGEITPDILVLLNLSRDQLDRHWELDVVFDKWMDAVESYPSDKTLVLDRTQDRFKTLIQKYKGEVHLFDDDRKNLTDTRLTGSFNAKNVNCALMVAEKLGVDQKKAGESLRDFEYAYGRGEKIEYGKKSWQIYLAKNPESLNQNLKLLLEGHIEYDSLLFVLNDNIPDGLDVSWIYDVDPKLLRKAGEKKYIFVAGIRALDMSVRLQYAGVGVKRTKIEKEVAEVVRRISADNNVKKVVVLPNYSAMLEFRKIVLGKSIL